MSSMNSYERYFFKEFRTSHNIYSNSKRVDMKDILKTEYSFIDDEE